jgi:hypothetical protein
MVPTFSPTPPLCEIVPSLIFLISNMEFTPSLSLLGSLKIKLPVTHRALCLMVQSSELVWKPRPSKFPYSKKKKETEKIFLLTVVCSTVVPLNNSLWIQTLFRFMVGGHMIACRPFIPPTRQETGHLLPLAVCF